MAYLVAAPEFLDSAASDLSNIGSALRAATASAAIPTTGIPAAAEDEVSAAIAALFAGHGRDFQALSAQAVAFHEQFAGNLSAGVSSYLSTEATSAATVAASVGGSSDLLQSIGGALVSELVSSIPGVQETELLFDATGPFIVTGSALAQSQTAFVSAVQTGNFGAAMSALVHAPGSVGNAFLYGRGTVTEPLSLPGLSVTLDIPVGGVLASLQPISATIAVVGSPPLTFPIPGTQVGGIVPALTSGLTGGGGLSGGGLLGGGLLGGGLLG